MKTLALCVLFLLSVLYNRVHSASLVKNEMINDADQVSDPEWSESNIMEPLLRTKRHSHLSICTICCNCCKKKGCNFCCLT
ncbi:hepcidin-1-like [Pelobates fuscus]|uniref:hepcidin-1-like n=1 Tax=Pelobates fuscus TaxID=191477 RepID=UPI002FE47B68